MEKILDRSDLDWYEVLLSDLSGARCLTISMLIENNEWDQLVSLKAEPSDYCYIPFNLNIKGKPNRKLFHNDFAWLLSDRDRFTTCSQVTNILRKCVDLPTSVGDVERALNALKTFRDSEDTNRITNIRLRSLRWEMENRLEPNNSNLVWRKLVNQIRKEIEKVLPSIPSTIDYKFSSGSTFADREFFTPMDKMSNRPTVTQQAWNVLHYDWSRTSWCKSLCSESPDRSLPRVIRGNRFTTVPKTALTDRGICIAPVLNVTAQLSVGRILRKALRSHGIDLKFGQSYHRELVKTASLKLDVGTIDLSAASDSMSYELVKLLFPPDWFDLLNSLREEYTQIPRRFYSAMDWSVDHDGWMRNQKFSAMGNGYTFELETLIFYCTALALSKCFNYQCNILTVYGDDIIIDTPMAGPLIKALGYFGFKTNGRKTFINGIPFRESCGADYYGGHNVRGLYVQKLPQEPLDWYTICNGIYRMGNANSDGNGLDDRYLSAWHTALAHIPRKFRSIRGPTDYGDSVLHDRHWKRYNPVRCDNRGRRFIDTLAATFSKRDYRSYDQRYWNRGSIITAAILRGIAGDEHKFEQSEWKMIRSRFLLRNAFPIGCKKARVEYTGFTSNPQFESLVNRFLRS